MTDGQRDLSFRCLSPNEVLIFEGKHFLATVYSSAAVAAVYNSAGMLRGRFPDVFAAIDFVSAQGRSL